MVFTSKPIDGAIPQWTCNTDGLNIFSTIFGQFNKQFPDVDFKYEMFDRYNRSITKHYENKHWTCKGKPTVLIKEVDHIQRHIDAKKIIMNIISTNW